MSRDKNDRDYDRMREADRDQVRRSTSFVDQVKNAYTNVRLHHDHSKCDKLIDKDKEYK